jgi:hypothetical protein
MSMSHERIGDRESVTVSSAVDGSSAMGASIPQPACRSARGHRQEHAAGAAEVVVQQLF